jgi:hypothetical protein
LDGYGSSGMMCRLTISEPTAAFSSMVSAAVHYEV